MAPSSRELATVLVAMPFVSSLHPSIQLGLLAELGRARGFRVETLHLNLDLVGATGSELYEALCRHRGCQVGDWLFSVEAFGKEAPDADGGFVDEFRPAIESLVEEAGTTAGRLRSLRQREIPAYLDRLEREVPWDRYDVVGFTSTFQQSAAAVAMARRVKRRHPGIVTLFGGANLEGEMGRELVRGIPEIDFAVDGPAETAFPAFLEALATDRDPAEIPGIVVKREGEVLATPPAAPLSSLDELPFPDYDEYFERAGRLGLHEGSRWRELALPLESSRGCWWGEVQHCTFCGLNGGTMAYRAKSTARVLDELAYLAGRHRVFQFQAADNIAAPSVHRELFPELEERQLDYRFFFEVKANLRRHQLRQMKRAGVEWIQPGIESLSSHVLELMRKGVRAIDNVNLLRWSLYYGLDVSWNILWGFPNEREEDYLGQARLVPQLAHLQPPASIAQIWLERFSPLYVDRVAFPARRIGAESSYGYVYPRSFDLDRVAYFFDFEFEKTLPREVTFELQRRVSEWKARWRAAPRPRLLYRSTPGLVQIEDERQPDPPRTYRLEGPLAELYLACSERPRRVPALARKLELADPEQEIEGALDLFCEEGLMMRDGDLFLSLALPATPNR
ncbi:MAG: B12-binding domain-containing radical SAM protein [Deltaproteobacteria bacterium]|jgi:ribosomal peptide maturation radical SAM protein 1|nr:B12-binding domain-containing radical SAM protein [Deltaproteobacteria bacterium]